MAGTLEYEQLNKNLEVVDGHAVKAPEDYQDPEQLYQALVARVRKYHPSTDISMIEKAYRIAKEAHKDQVPYGWELSLRILRWIRKRLLRACCMTQWKILQ